MLFHNRLELTPVNVFGDYGIFQFIVPQKGAFNKDHGILQNGWIQGEGVGWALHWLHPSNGGPQEAAGKDGWIQG